MCDLVLTSISGYFLLEQIASTSHRKIESQRLLAHQIAHGIETQHTRRECERTSRYTDGLCMCRLAVCCREVKRRDERKGHLDCEEDADVTEIQRQRADEEENVQDGPH